MKLHIQTLYRCDPDGRLRYVNEVGDPVAPRFYMGRTHRGNRWRFRHDLPADVVEELDRLCCTEPVTTDLANPPRGYAAIRAVLQRHSPVMQDYRGPAYWIAEDTQPWSPVVLITEANVELVRAGFPWILSLPRDKDVGPIAAVIEQGYAVSVCYCSRRPAQATEAGVETLPAFRGRGYATDAVAGWAAEVRRLGIVPLYSTSWDNRASQRIAQKLRMVLYGEDWSIE